MARGSWIAQAYGYVVCIVAVITFLISVSGFVDAMFERSNPLQAGNRFGPGSMTSFEAYQATHQDGRPTRVSPNASDQSDTLTTAQLRARYEVLRADQLAQVRYSSSMRLVRSGLLIVICGVLFVTHWRWLQRQRDVSAA